MCSIDELSNLLEKLNIGCELDKGEISDLTKMMNGLSLYDINELSYDFSNLSINVDKDKQHLTIKTKFGKSYIISITNCHTNYNKKNPLFVPLWTSTF